MRLFNDEPSGAEHYDVVGIGIGPANLSLAALLDSERALRLRFFDGKQRLAWHSGLMFRGAEMQSSFLEDLVTPVDPTNRLSFMSFLAETGHIFSFLCRNTTTIARMEFQQYLGWAAGKLPCLAFGEPVEDVRFNAHHFEVRTALRTCHARSIAVGVGKAPVIPPWAQRHLSDKCFHIEELLDRRPVLEGARVAIVGGGQSAADLMTALLGGELGKPAELHWMTRRGNLQGLDDSPFVNEFHTPQYVEHFLSLRETTKRQLIAEQKLFGDGITRECLENLYKAIYRRNYVDGPTHAASVYPNCAVVGLAADSGKFALTLHSLPTERRSLLAADLVILCTGYEDTYPTFLEPLRPRLMLSPLGQYVVSRQYRVAWDGPDDNAIYALNAARHSHGIADSYLCLAAWRAALIVNDILGFERYRATPLDSFIRWDGQPAPVHSQNYPLPRRYDTGSGNDNP
jgi:lysine N6-hydroxylase